LRPRHSDAVPPRPRRRAGLRRPGARVGAPTRRRRVRLLPVSPQWRDSRDALVRPECRRQIQRRRARAARGVRRPARARAAPPPARRGARGAGRRGRAGPRDSRAGAAGGGGRPSRRRGGATGGSGGEPGQVGVPGDDVTRAPHADQRDARLHAAARPGTRRPAHRAAARVPRAPNAEQPAPARARQ
jgi:hypothetical protein